MQQSAALIMLSHDAITQLKLEPRERETESGGGVIFVQQFV